MRTRCKAHGCLLEGSIYRNPVKPVFLYEKFIFMPPPQQATEALCFRVGRKAVHPSVRCASVKTYFVGRYISSLSGSILMTLATDIHHMSGQCCKGFQGHRSKVKVVTRSNAITAEASEAHLCSYGNQVSRSAVTQIYRRKAAQNQCLTEARICTLPPLV